MRIGLRTLELAFGVIKAKGWKEISIPFFAFQLTIQNLFEKVMVYKTFRNLAFI